MDIFSPTIIDDVTITGSSNASLLRVSSPSNTNILFISGSGNVGIGTSNPTEKLYVDGNLVVTGRITAEEFHTEFVSASIIYQSGSTQFGNSLDDTHTFTGSINTTGSLSLKGPLYDNLGTAGTADQILFTTSTGVEWRDNVANSAQDLVVTGKNVGVSTIQKGTPLYFTGSGTSGNIVGILPADAGNPDRMPAGGVAGEQITAGNEGDVYIYGIISGVDTSAFSSGDDIFVAVGGGYTNIKPTGSVLIQKLGNVEKSDPTNGSGVIQGPSWYNDLPNWEIGRVMVGRSNGQPVTSSIVYLDESNSRLGLGTTSPSAHLHISGASNSNLLQVQSPAQTNIFVISGSGNVGIGTSTPTQKLHILNGNILLTDTNYIDWSNGSERIIGGGSGTGFSLQFSTYDGANLTEKMRISGSGNVGIGTTTPAAKLQISTVGNGSSSLDAAGSSFNGVHAILPGRIYVGASSTAYPQIMYNAIPSQSAAWRYATNDTAWAIDMGGGNQMRFRYAGVGTAGNNITWTEIMVLASGSGNVGIGTSSPTNRLQVVGGVTATSFTGSLLGTASLAVNALTASFVNTLNQNVVITGSAAIGTSSLGPSENTLTLGARDSVNEGGQLGLNAPGGTYASASFIDNYQNQFRILRGSNNGSNASVAGWNLHSLQMSLTAYTNTSSFPGTATANLAVDSSGNVITVSTAGGSVFPYVGNAVITGSLTTTGIIYAQPNGGMYFQGGDDAALYDINISNHMGIYGVQDSTVASIKLGSGGGIISGRDNRIGIGITSPSASLHISGASADRLLQVGSPTLANTLFVTGSGRVGIGTNTPSQLFEIVRSSNTKIVAGDNVGIQTGTASEWIHLSSDPASSKYIRIDATQFSASPTEQGGSPDTAIGQSGNTNKYLTEPDYWMEIVLGAAGGIVLIPCYIKG